jgi:hypothetical protein
MSVLTSLLIQTNTTLFRLGLCIPSAGYACSESPKCKPRGINNDSAQDLGLSSVCNHPDALSKDSESRQGKSEEPVSVAFNSAVRLADVSAKAYAGDFRDSAKQPKAGLCL